MPGEPLHLSVGREWKTIASATPAARAGDAEPEHHRRKLPDIDADRACGVAIRRMLKQAAFSGSNLKLDPYFHNLRARNLEICTRPLGIVMHEGE